MAQMRYRAEQIVAKLGEEEKLQGRHPRYGCRMVWAILCGEGFEANCKRIERLWRLAPRRATPPDARERRLARLGTMPRGTAQARFDPPRPAPERRTRPARTA
jgi:hypothetical protein